MRICPARHGAFAEGAELCPDCGERLVVDRFGCEPVPGLRLQRLVGRGGGRATVWEGVRDDGRGLAVKLTEPEADAAEIQRLIATASLVQGLVHPNLTAVHAVGRTHEGDAFVVMDLLRGRSLLQVLEHKRALTPVVAVHVARAALAGLAALHGHGVVHRDVKPANIHLTAPGGGAAWEVKILDFGIARRFHAGDVPATLELGRGAYPGQHGPLVGTPEYMAPEQVLGLPCDPRADVYAVGVVLQRLLTGALPFVAPDRAAVLEAHLRASPLPLEMPDGFPAPDALQLVVARALAKHPGDRHRTATDMLQALGGP
ncbi:MAG: serine/threonine protein kinase [Deltaproteobacteria bacterium]|nr:serine/threonine protein kinase [Deltaproteobacteria bacterium]